MRFLAPASLLLILLGLTTGTLRLWGQNGVELVPAGRYLLGAGLVAGLLSLADCIRHRKFPRREDLTDSRVWALGLIVLFISDWITRPYAFFQGPAIRGELLIGCLCSCALIRRYWQGLVPWLLISCVVFLIATFLSISKGALLISDDHAMFLFRLHLLKENFPSIPFWSPLWNAGFDARDFFATGALNAFILASPLLYLFEVERVYNIIVALFIWGLAPAATYYAARLLGRPRSESALAAVLVMCTGLTWYRWTLTYGTMGFLVSSALFPLAAALFLKFIAPEEPRVRELALFVAVLTLMLLWSLSGVALIPVALVALPHTLRILRSRRRLLTIVAILMINLPWMLMLWKVSNVGRFLHSDVATSAVHQTGPTSLIAGTTTETAGTTLAQGTNFRHKKGSLSIRKSLDAWQESSGSLNPLVLILVIPALLALKGTQRIAFGSLVLWLLLLGTIGVSLKPQLELDRMIVLASVLVCIPISQLVAEIYTSASRGRSYACAWSVVGAFILIGPFSVSAILHNRAYDHFYFAEPVVQELSDAIKRYSRGGRALFTGCVMHELSGGHLAPLSIWSGTPLVASSYAHNIWKYEQPIPKSYLIRNESGIRDFFDHMNATLILAHEPEPRQRLASQPDLYAERWRGGRFVLFERLTYDPSYVLTGEVSSLSQNHNSVTVVPESESVVLKFRYFPFLTTDTETCSVHPYRVAPELELLELRGCPLKQKVTIRSVSPLQRLMGRK